MSDDHGEVEPPLPIPNRAVKRLSADDSADYPCESRTSSGTHKNERLTLPGWGVCFFGGAAPGSSGGAGPAQESGSSTRAGRSKAIMAKETGQIRVGIGGWTFAPWRGAFYPEGLKHAQELAYASARLTAIEINGTFYRTQTAAVFRKWARETPEDFRFSVKAHRYVTHRTVLAEAGDAVSHFLGSGLGELGDKLGPLLWQFPPQKKFEPADFRGFLQLLPHRLGKRRLRHAVDVRNDSFLTGAFVELLREFEVAAVYTDHPGYPSLADVTSDFVYARLQQGRDSLPTAYPAKALDDWAGRARRWAGGGYPDDLPELSDRKAGKEPRDVFLYFIHEGKIRAPAAAMALIGRLRR